MKRIIEYDDFVNCYCVTDRVAKYNEANNLLGE